MSTALSGVDICNLALDLLRQQEKVEDIENPESDTEGMCARWYDVTRRSVLRAFPWNFARKRANLSLNNTSPGFGYPNAYNLPNDYLELVFVGDNYDADYDTDYAVEGGQLLIDNDSGATINICYIQDTKTVAKYDALFVDLLVAELALRFANSLTGVNKSMKEIKAWRDDVRGQARTKNGQENPIKRREVSPIITRRQAVCSGSSTFDGTHLLS
jgi:hypothetical protein